MREQMSGHIFVKRISCAGESPTFPLLLSPGEIAFSPPEFCVSMRDRCRNDHCGANHIRKKTDEYDTLGPRFGLRRIALPRGCGPAFHWVGQQQGVDFRLLKEIRNINESRREIFFKKIVGAVWTLRGKRVAALGLAFKGGFDGAEKRLSLRLWLAANRQERRHLVLCDPHHHARADGLSPVCALACATYLN